MCRNIKHLFNFDPPVTEEEVQQAALQFVRKISGLNKPSRANELAFLKAVDEIAGTTSLLLSTLKATGSPKNREVEIAKAKDRNFRRLGV